jgi:hypothetical protein
MKYAKRWLVLALIVACLPLAACAKKPAASTKSQPAKIEKIPGTDFSRVTLTAKAAERLGIETALVREAKAAVQPASLPAKTTPIAGKPAAATQLTTSPVKTGDPVPAVVVKTATADAARTVVPYASLIYDQKGRTWVYTKPEPKTEPLAFVRHAITIDRIEGDDVFCTAGPPAGTVVLTTGAAEMYGTEFKVGH